MKYTIGQGPLIGLDFETFCHEEGGRPLGQPVCVTLFDGEHNSLFHVRDPQSRAAVEWVLDHGIIVAFNLAFDLSCIVEVWPDLVDKVYALLDDGRGICLMVWETLYVLATAGLADDQSVPGGLAAAAKSLLGIEVDKGADTWRLRYGELWDVPCDQWPEDARNYALFDARLHHDVAVAMAARDRATFGKAVPALVHESRVAFGIRAQETNGFAVNAASVDRLIGHEEHRLALLTTQCKDAGFVRRDGSKDQAAVQAFVEEQLIKRGLDVRKFQTAKGTSTAGTTFAFCGSDKLNRLQERDHVKKYLSTYLDRCERKSIVYPRWRSIVSSGRTACSKPPVHQWPREPGYREIFEAEDGYAFVVADFAAAELRHLAAICYSWFGVSNMREAFIAGIDVHAHFGAKLLRMDYATFEAARAAGDEQAASARDMAKPANFGWPTKMGTARFMDSAAKYKVDHLIKPSEVPRMRDLWAQTWVEMPMYWEKIARLARGGVVFEQPWSGRLRAGCTFTAMANQPFQGGTADAAKLSAYLVRKATETGSGWLRYATLNHSVHDELVVKCPVDVVHEVAIDVEAIMVYAASTVAPNCPHGVDVVASKRWSKKAKRIVTNGRLQVWDGP